jgi:hypothetical protein
VDFHNTHYSFTCFTVKVLSKHFWSDLKTIRINVINNNNDKESIVLISNLTICDARRILYILRKSNNSTNFYLSVDNVPTQRPKNMR